MKEMLKNIVKHLTEYPDDIEINEKDSEKCLVLELKVNQADVGRIIGKQGRIAKAIRTLMKAYATKEGKKVNVEIVD